jgi:organic hydroperoxide reductase OsmC/OhrA
MKFSARLQNEAGSQQIAVRAGEKEQSLLIEARERGGSTVTGGELLFLALATCYCNDVYCEADKAGIEVQSVEVEVEGDFEGPGKPGFNIRYRAKVEAEAGPERIHELMLHTDTVAEIQNTVRLGAPVRLEMPDTP